MSEEKTSFLGKIYSKPKLNVLVIVAITVFFAMQLPRVKIDNNNFNFIPKDDPARIANEEVAKIFGEETPILLGVERKYNNVFDLDFINQLRKIDETLAEMPSVKRTISILNTDHMEGEDGAMIARPLIDENYKGTPAEIQALKYKLRDWSEMYSRTLISEDFKAVQFVVFLSVSCDEAGSPEALAVCRKALEIAKNWDFPDSEVFVTGTPVVSEIVNEATAHDLAILVPIVVLVVVGVLYLSFRRLLGVLLPLLTVIISVIWSVGAMPLFGVKLSILSTVMPVILVAVGSAYGIHVITHYFDHIDENIKELSKDEHKLLIIDVMKKIIWPVFLAALTTFAGFVSFCFTPVLPIFHFGIFASFGVMVAFVVAVLLIPSILILTGPKVLQRSKKIGKKSSKLDSFIAKTFLLISKRKRTVLFFLVVALSGSAFLSREIVVENILVEYFKNDPTVANADRFVREKFSGAKEVFLIIKADQADVVVRPDVLLAVDKFTEYFSAHPEVGKITSLSTLIKRINQVINSDASAEGLAQVEVDSSVDDSFGELGDFSDFDDFGELGDFSEFDEYNDDEIENKVAGKEPSISFCDLIKYLDAVVKEAPTPESISARELSRALAEKINYNGLSYYEIPSDPAKYGKVDMDGLQAIIHDYLILLASNLDGFVDNSLSPKVQKVAVQLLTTGEIDTKKVVNEMSEYINANFPKDVKVQIAGTSLVEQSLNDLVVNSQFVSLGISLAIVFMILTVYYRSLVAGIIGIIPLALSILANFATMAVLGIKVNIGTSLVASFAIGIGIDYTIHYLDAYHREILAANDNGDFLYKTFYGSGKAIIFNAISVGAGFAVLIFSDFRMLSDLGLLICLVMGVSSLASLTVLPVLLNTLKPKFIRKIFKRDKIA
ncbi:MAG: efflux RND transporter permease subunit [Treponemataceae bacterium]